MTLAKRKLKFLCEVCENTNIFSNYKNICETNQSLLQEIQQLKSQGNESNIDKVPNTSTQEISLPELQKFIKDGNSQVIQEIRILRESNKELIRLLSNAPSNYKLNLGHFEKEYNPPIKGTHKENVDHHVNHHPQISTPDITSAPTLYKDTKIQLQEKNDRTSSQKQILDNHVEQNLLNTDDTRFVQVKRKSRIKRNIGTAESELKDSEKSEFEGRQNVHNQKKIWLFISRAKSHVTKEIVCNYVAKKCNTNMDAISVKPLDTWHKVENNNCFLVGVDPNLKSIVYEPNFWPRGVAFDRFNFRRGQHFLDNSRNTSHRGNTERSEEDF